MNIVLNNIQSALIDKLKVIAQSHGIPIEEEIKIIVEDYLNQKIAKSPQELGWSDDFFEKTAGICTDDPIVIDDIDK